MLSKDLTHPFTICRITTVSTFSPVTGLLAERYAGVHYILQIQSIQSELQLHVQRKHQGFLVRNVLVRFRAIKEYWCRTISTKHLLTSKFVTKKTRFVSKNRRHAITQIAVNFQLAHLLPHSVKLNRSIPQRFCFQRQIASHLRSTTQTQLVTRCATRKLTRLNARKKYVKNT